MGYDFVRWHRTGRWLTDGERLLIWEYPRAAPDGDQVDLIEVMEIADGRARGGKFICPPGVQAVGCQDQRRREHNGVR
jgi:hypothetical protein